MRVCIFVFLFTIVGNFLMAQQGIDNLSCSDNPYFQTPCNGVIGTACPTWSDNCSGGWIRSHGSPQLVPYTIVDPKSGTSFSANVLYMWHILATGFGEGAFREYNFKANRPYKITLRVNTSSVNGTIYIYAANGLTQSIYNNCGNPIPSITQKQLIGTYSGSVNQWTDVTLNFVPTIDYTKLWIYPQQTGAPNGQYDVNVSYFQACPSCEENISYYNPSITTIPVGDTRAKNIYVGSQAGLTIVNQALSVTRLIATNEIVLSSDFEAKVLTNGSFLAGIYPCGYSGPIGSRSIPISSFANIPMYRSSEFKLSFADSIAMNGTWKVFPTLTTDKIYIKNNNVNNYLLIKIYSETGKQVYVSSISNSTNLIQIDVSKFSQGLYFIQLSNNSLSQTSKFIVVK